MWGSCGEPGEGPLGWRGGVRSWGEDGWLGVHGVGGWGERLLMGRSWLGGLVVGGSGSGEGAATMLYVTHSFFNHTRLNAFKDRSFTIYPPLHACAPTACIFLDPSPLTHDLHTLHYSTRDS